MPLAKSPDAQKTLLKISQSIIGTLDYEKVLQIISDGMAELLGIESSAIYLLENKNEIYLGATTPPLNPNMPDSLRFANINDHPHIRKTITSRTAQILLDSQKEPLSPAEREVVELRNLRTCVYFPFIQENDVLGVLILTTINKVREFSQEEINLGQTVANQLSIGIQNARLHHDITLKNQALVKEIAERQKTEQSLRTSETHLSNALKIAKLGHWEYDVKKDTFIFSSEFYTIFNTTVEEIGSYSLSSSEYAKKFVHPEDQHIVTNEIKNAIEKRLVNYSNEIEHRMLYASGEMGYILVRYKTLNDENGHVIRLLGANQDITERKLAEFQLLESNKKLEQSEQELEKHRDHLELLVKEKTQELDNTISKLQNTNHELQNTLDNLRETQKKLIQAEKMASLGVLTAGVAHEINNPLNYIMGSYTAIKSFIKNNPPENHKEIETALSHLKVGLDKATDIVKGLNQFSRDNERHDEDCDINLILGNCLTILNNKLKDQIKINQDFNTNDLIVIGNVGQLHQAFLNVLTNSIQAIEGKGEITIKSFSQDKNAIIEIADTGIGIDSDILHKVTDPFFTTKDPGQGTGLGLSITYSIIQEHHGNIDFESIPGKGTTVTISIPFN